VATAEQLEAVELRDGGGPGGGGHGGEGESRVVVAGSVASLGAVGEGEDVGAVGFESVAPVFAVVVVVAAPTFGDGVGEVGEPALLPRRDVVDVAVLG